MSPHTPDAEMPSLENPLPSRADPDVNAEFADWKEGVRGSAYDAPESIRQGLDRLAKNQELDDAEIEEGIAELYAHEIMLVHILHSHSPMRVDAHRFFLAGVTEIAIRRRDPKWLAYAFASLDPRHSAGELRTNNTAENYPYVRPVLNDASQVIKAVGQTQLLTEDEKLPFWQFMRDTAHLVMGPIGPFFVYEKLYDYHSNPQDRQAASDLLVELLQDPEGFLGEHIPSDLAKRKKSNAHLSLHKIETAFSAIIAEETTGTELALMHALEGVKATGIYEHTAGRAAAYLFDVRDADPEMIAAIENFVDDSAVQVGQFVFTREHPDPRYPNERRMFTIPQWLAAVKWHAGDRQGEVADDDVWRCMRTDTDNICAKIVARRFNRPNVPDQMIRDLPRYLRDVIGDSRFRIRITSAGDGEEALSVVHNIVEMGTELALASQRNARSPELAREQLPRIIAALNSFWPTAASPVADENLIQLVRMQDQAEGQK